jgi:hypothetical protein
MKLYQFFAGGAKQHSINCRLRRRYNSFKSFRRRHRRASGGGGISSGGKSRVRRIKGKTERVCKALGS